MKKLNLLLFAGIAMAFAACNDEKTPPADPEYDVTTNMSLLSAEYHGDEGGDGVAKFKVALQVDYEKNLITRAEGEMKAKEIFNLTFFAPIVLDAEFALPEEGTYNVAPEKGLFKILAGTSASEGSYLASTVDGVTKESKITGGSVTIGYSNGKCVYTLSLEDNDDLLAKYNGIELQYAGNELFDNNAIEYNNFINQGNDYNRCWYWGEPLGDRASDDGSPLGEYMFVFSNAKDSEVVSEGQVMATFSLLDVFQIYGLDRKITPGVYRVNQDGFSGKLGTIYKGDITDPYAPYSGTAQVDVFENGATVKKFVVDGYMAVFGDQNGKANRFVVDFDLEDGGKFHGRYDGELAIGDEWTFSNFRENLEIDNLASAYMRIKKPDWLYQQAGTNQWELYLMGPGVSVSFDEYGYEIIHGPGDCFRFAISTDPSVIESLPAGTYNIEDSHAAGVAQQGDKGIAWIGIYSGAFFHRIPVTGVDDLMNALGLSGSLKLSKTGDVYTFEVTLNDDAKNTHTATFTGTPVIQDHRPVEGGAPGSERTNRVYKQFSPVSKYYDMARTKRVDAAKARLK